MTAEDPAIDTAIEQVRSVTRGDTGAPVVKGFFHEPTFSASYVVSDPVSARAVIIDSVLDFDQASGRTSTEAADRIAAYARDAGLAVDWILETHVHADHLSAAAYLQEQLGGKVAIGADI